MKHASNAMVVVHSKNTSYCRIQHHSPFLAVRGPPTKKAEEGAARAAAATTTERSCMAVSSVEIFAAHLKKTRPHSEAGGERR